MTTIPIQNKSSAVLRIMLEPWANEYDVEPGMTVVLSGNLEGIQMDYHSDNYITFWIEAEVKVLLGDYELDTID